MLTSDINCGKCQIFGVMYYMNANILTKKNSNRYSKTAMASLMVGTVVHTNLENSEFHLQFKINVLILKCQQLPTRYKI